MRASAKELRSKSQKYLKPCRAGRRWLSPTWKARARIIRYNKSRNARMQSMNFFGCGRTTPR